MVHDGIGTRVPQILSSSVRLAVAITRAPADFAHWIA